MSDSHFLLRLYNWGLSEWLLIETEFQIHKNLKHKVNTPGRLSLYIMLLKNAITTWAYLLKTCTIIYNEMPRLYFDKLIVNCFNSASSTKTHVYIIFKISGEEIPENSFLVKLSKFYHVFHSLNWGDVHSFESNFLVQPVFLQSSIYKSKRQLKISP